MAKISEEEYQEMLPDKRHEELIRSLKDIADRSNVNDLVREVGNLVKAMQEPKSETQEKIDLGPIAKELSSGIAELKTVLEVRPKAYTIERSTLGLIERIVPEY